MNTIQSIAITGSNGYVGGYLKNYLQAAGFLITDMNRQACNNAACIMFDLNKKNNLEMLSTIDCIIHCAYDFSVHGYKAIEKSNVGGSLYLFEQAKKMGVKKIIYISSVSAFEGAIANYGRAKYQIEMLAKNFDVTVVRPGLVFNKNLGGIIGSLNKLVQRSPVIPLIGRGDQQFFPCHIDDLSQLIHYLISQHHDITSPIVAASEHSISFKEIIKTLSVFNKKSVITFPIPYCIIHTGLRIAEILGINAGLRSDSIKYLKHYNKHLDFNKLKKTGINFREFSIATLST